MSGIHSRDQATIARTYTDNSPAQVIIDFVEDYTDTVAGFFAHSWRSEDERMGTRLVRGVLIRSSLRDGTGSREVMSSTIWIGPLQCNFLHLTDRTAIVWSDPALVDFANGQRRRVNAGLGIGEDHFTTISYRLRSYRASLNMKHQHI